ncbi:MAG: hypothetical protein IKP65_05190 [Alphaproteobacteria bacterium]|nr:hypothetical protein [Alphaproteobacteria bacterium]
MVSYGQRLKDYAKVNNAIGASPDLKNFGRGAVKPTPKKTQPSSSNQSGQEDNAAIFNYKNSAFYSPAMAKNERQKE